MRVKLKHRRLSEELSRSRLSLNGWAQRLGLSSGHLSDLVNGRRAYPSPATREKLLEGLGLPFESLFELESVDERPLRSSRRGARVAFRDGSRDRPRTLPRPMGGTMSSFIRDLRFGARALWRSPGFSLAALLTLAVGIGSNAALFGIVDSILWKPYPYPDADRLVAVHSVLERRGGVVSNLSFPDVRDIREESDLLDGLAAWDWEPYALAGTEEPRRVGGTRVSAGFFDVIGVPPLAGRTFAPEDDRPGAEPVVILSEALWERVFGRDRGVVGTGVTVNARPTTVVGVMPHEATYPDQTELWVPLAFDESVAPRGQNFLGTIGRLKDGVELESLGTELSAIAARVAADHPQTNEGRGFAAMTLREALSGDMRALSVALVGVVTFLLLIVCANVANLLLSRGVAREREVAIRRSVGASSGRLAQGLLTESLLLSAVGGIAGLGLAALAVQQILRMIAIEIPPWIRVELDLRVVLYTAAVTTAATLLFSLFPLLQTLGLDVSARLSSGGRRQGASSRGSRVRSTLVVAEVSLALVLLVGAGLLLRSVVVMSAVETGFEPRGALVVGLDLLAQRDAEPEERGPLFHRYLERFESIPGVDSVGAINMLPLRRRSNSGRVTAFGQSAEEAERNLEPQLAAVTPDYFQAMGIPLKRGDTLEHAPSPRYRTQVVVSERLADSLWPGRDPIGERFKLGGPYSESPWLTVRGVVGDIVHRGLDRERPGHVYLSYDRAAPSRMTVVLRTAGGSPESLVPSLRAAAREVDPSQPLHEISTLTGVVDLSMWQWRFFGAFFWWFGATALALALIGIYGVMSYAVGQRRREVGLRMALGARERDVVAMVLRQGGRLVIAGVACGLPLAAGLGAALAGSLFAVQPFEPLLLAGVSAVLTAVSLAAVLVPARRAARVDPAGSLRVE